MSMHPTSSQASSRRAVGLFGVCAGFCVAVPALAAAPIGSATSVNQSVTGALSGRPFLVSVGDPVKLRETVRTDAFGQARLILVDDTDVAVLSGSTMTIERYAPGSKVVSAPDGTFLIHTGNGSPGELHVNTSAGTLTPQGTRFWFDVRGGHIKLDVQEGAVRFCPRGKGPAYCVVSIPGHDVIGSAGAPAQVLGMVEPPASRPIYTPPVHYGDNNTYSTTPNDCGRAWYVANDPRHPCARGVTGGGKTGGGNDGKHPTVTNGYPPGIAERTGHRGFPFRRSPGFGMGGFGRVYH
jgi:FecR protein